MHPDPDNLGGADRLSQISTLWSALQQARSDLPEEARAAQIRLLQRYEKAVRRYLLKAADGDDDAAAELFQVFALRLIEGAFRHADPGKGRFRDYLRVSLARLVNAWRRGARRFPVALAALPEVADDPPADEPDFRALWESELMDRVWTLLQRRERLTGRPLHRALRYVFDRGDVSSEELAEHLGPVLAGPVTSGRARKILHEARKTFRRLVVEEVARDLDGPTYDQLAEELADLRLLDSCREALEAWRDRAAPP